ncbi:sensor histidine kinase [Cohnella thailandensis]|uniref:histidine kinase n=1 Tax=Cohnella thailandensis TaxID=557557 RepID=A0A841SLK3_9BACL|nr:sensor histidine kinase [Cohnella thailandensis]
MEVLRLYRKFKFVSIKNKMAVLFIISILIPILILFINSYLSSQQMLESKYTDLLEDITRQSNIRIEEFLDDTEQISLISSYGINSYVSAVSQENYPVQNYLRNASQSNENQATQLLMNYITMKERAFSVYIYNLNGGQDLLVSTNKPVDYTYHPRNESWFRDFLASEDITRDLPTRIDLQTKQENNWAIYHLRKIFDLENGKLLGLMVISIDIDFINKVNKRLQESSRSAFTIVDENERVIFNSDYSRINRPFSELFPLKAKIDKDTAREVVKSGGKSYILIHSAFEAHNWTTYIYMPVEELAVEGNILMRNLWMIVMALVLFAIISSFYLSNLITRPIKRLMKNMTLVEQGRFDNLPAVKSNDEIGLLAKRFEQMSSELKQLVERIYHEQEEKAEAEIRALQAQINPHFLYNTLNSVKWIASMQRADKIVEMTEALISILRYSSKVENRMVPIREEFDNIAHYLTIQKVRYFNRIAVSYRLDERLLDYEILKLSIQPLVENAIFHGIADQEDGTLTIEVTACGENDIAIRVGDNGAGMEEEASAALRQRLKETDGHSGSIGVFNVHNRIRRVFGERYGIDFASKKGKGTTFTITIPRTKKGEIEQ